MLVEGSGVLQGSISSHIKACIPQEYSSFPHTKLMCDFLSVASEHFHDKIFYAMDFFFSFNAFICVIPNISMERVTFLLHIWKVQISDVVLGTDYPWSPAVALRAVPTQ